MSLAVSVSRWRENSALRRDPRRAARRGGGNTHRYGGSCTTGCAPCGSWTWPSCLLLAERAGARAKRDAGRHRTRFCSAKRNLTRAVSSTRRNANGVRAPRWKFWETKRGKRVNEKIAKSPSTLPSRVLSAARVRRARARSRGDALAVPDDHLAYAAADAANHPVGPARVDPRVVVSRGSAVFVFVCVRARGFVFVIRL